MKISGIYKIINRINGKYYVGSSKDIYGGSRGYIGRWKQHKNELNKNIHKNLHLQNSWNKYGEQNFDFVIVENIEPIRKKLLKVEQKYLDVAKLEKNKIYNVSFIAGRPEMTDDVKRKISLKNAGNKYCLGRKLSNETKKKMSISKTGKNNPQYGKIKNIESRNKIRELIIKRQNCKYANIIYNWHNKWTKEKISCTQYDLYTKYNFPRGSISHVARRRIPSYKGWCLLK